MSCNNYPKKSWKTGIMALFQDKIIKWIYLNNVNVATEFYIYYNIIIFVSILLLYIGMIYNML